MGVGEDEGSGVGLQSCEQGDTVTDEAGWGGSGDVIEGAAAACGGHAGGNLGFGGGDVLYGRETWCEGSCLGEGPPSDCIVGPDECAGDLDGFAGVLRAGDGDGVDECGGDGRDEDVALLCVAEEAEWVGDRVLVDEVGEAGLDWLRPWLVSRLA